MNTLQNIRNASASKVKMADDNKENECHLDSEINTLTVNILKDYLRRHNQNVTGKKEQSWLYAQKG